MVFKKMTNVTRHLSSSLKSVLNPYFTKNRKSEGFDPTYI